MPNANIYEERLRYTKRFIEAKTVNDIAPGTKSEQLRDIYVLLFERLTEMERIFKPEYEKDSEYVSRIIMWALISSAEASANQTEDRESVAIFLGVAEELAAILTTHYPDERL